MAKEENHCSAGAISE